MNNLSFLNCTVEKNIITIQLNFITSLLYFYYMITYFSNEIRIIRVHKRNEKI